MLNLSGCTSVYPPHATRKELNKTVLVTRPQTVPKYVHNLSTRVQPGRKPAAIHTLGLPEARNGSRFNGGEGEIDR